MEGHAPDCPVHPYQERRVARWRRQRDVYRGRLAYWELRGERGQAARTRRVLDALEAAVRDAEAELAALCTCDAYAVDIEIIDRLPADFVGWLDA